MQYYPPSNNTTRRYRYNPSGTRPRTATTSSSSGGGGAAGGGDGGGDGGSCWCGKCFWMSLATLVRRYATDRALVLVGLTIGSLSLMSSHWAYRLLLLETGGQSMDKPNALGGGGGTNANHVMLPLHLLSSSSSKKSNRNRIPRRERDHERDQSDHHSGSPLSRIIDHGLLLPEISSHDTSLSYSTSSSPPLDSSLSTTKTTMEDNAVPGKVEEKEDKEEEPYAAVVWNHKTTTNHSFPIINVGLPKSGEDTIWNFFHKLGFVTQFGCGDTKKQRLNCVTLGVCIYTNVRKKVPIFTNCSTQLASVDSTKPEFQVYTQLDAFRVLNHRRRPVITGQILPQINFLEQLYQSFPNATWILPLHLPAHWAYTISRQHMLRQRLWNEIWVMKHGAHIPVRNRRIFQPQLSEMPAIDYWTKYYELHTKRIRDFVKHHPTIRLVELQYRLRRAPHDLLDSLGLILPTTTMQMETSDAKIFLTFGSA